MFVECGLFWLVTTKRYGPVHHCRDVSIVAAKRYFDFLLAFLRAWYQTNVKCGGVTG